MKNGCKTFSSPTMDKLNIEPYYQNRVDDIVFAKTKLRQLNSRGLHIEDTMTLMTNYINIFGIFMNLLSS